MIMEEINKASAAVIATLKEAAKGDPKKEKQIALMENAMAFVKELTEVGLLIRKRKRILKPINRTPKRRMQRKQKIFRKMMNIQMLEMNRLMILQTPIPKFPKGGFDTHPEKGAGIIYTPEDGLIKFNRPFN